MLWERGWGRGAGAKRTSAVPPPSPAPEQVSKRRRGDTAQQCATPALPAPHSPASDRAEPGVQGTGLALYPAAWRDRKPAYSSSALSARRPPPALYLGDLRTPRRRRRRRACSHRESRNARVRDRDAPSERESRRCALLPRRAGAARGTTRAPPTSERGCPRRTPPRTLTLPSPPCSPFPEYRTRFSVVK